MRLERNSSRMWRLEDSSRIWTWKGSSMVRVEKVTVDHRGILDQIVYPILQRWIIEWQMLKIIFIEKGMKQFLPDAFPSSLGVPHLASYSTYKPLPRALSLQRL